MLQQEKLKKQRLEQLAHKPTSSAEAEYFSHFNLPDFGRQAPRRDQTVMAGGRAFDPRCVLVQSSGVAMSPNQREQQRQSVERVSFMVDHPLAATAYGLTSLTPASPSARDRALMAGGAVDTVMMGAAPLGASPLRRVAPPRTRATGPVLDRKGFVLREPTSRGAIGGFGRITADMLGTGTRARWSQKPPGWQGHGTQFNEARGHLVGGQLGGKAILKTNLVTLTHHGANTPQMSKFENQVARRVRAGEVIDYSATALYGNGALPPEAVLLTAIGSRGGPSAKLVFNPAGRRK
jgi:hypothetical protein